MSYSSAADHRALNPFSSLTAPPASSRFWLVELVVAPFRDLDERAHYRAARQAAARDDGATDMTDMIPAARHAA